MHGMCNLAGGSREICVMIFIGSRVDSDRSERVDLTVHDGADLY